MDFDCHRDMFNAIGHIALILDSQHNILEANRAALKAIGKSEEELKGKKCYEILHSTDHPPENCPIEKMRLSGHLESSEMVVEALNGIYLVSCTPQFDEKSVFESVIHIATDITKSENAKKALKVSEESYRQLIETEPECVKLLTEDNIIVDMNPAGLSMIEADSLEQVVGKSIVDLIDPAFKDDFVNLVRRVFEGESAILEFSITGLKGTKRWLETYAAPLRDENDKINFLLSVTRDTTERKQAEEALQRSELRLKRAQQIAHLADWEYDIEHDTYTGSDESHRIFGNDPTTELTYGQLREMVHPNDLDIFDKSQMSLIESGMGKPFECRIVRADGSIRHLHIQGEVERDSTGKINKLFGIFHDITERKQAEEELLKYREHLEEQVKERTAELNRKNAELERINRVFVGRELRMIELKKQIVNLNKRIAELESLVEDE
ncbi:MAG: PAS domain S-box protein [Methanosarcinaceae archaeon]|nr:PAS domain S-box protein [Methanosarcinaceae archaeon]